MSDVKTKNRIGNSSTSKIKYCPACGTVKLKTEFSPNKQRLSECNGVCRQCVVAEKSSKYAKYARDHASKVRIKGCRKRSPVGNSKTSRVKHCSHCGTVKYKKEFSHQSSKISGRYAFCQKCESKKTGVYKRNHKSNIKSYSKNLYSKQKQSPRYKFRTYFSSAEKRNLQFGITQDEFNTFWGKPCHYCNAEIPTIGLDRLDNSKGYVLGNLVPCCKTCNISKLTMSKEEYVAHCLRVVENFSKRIKAMMPADHESRNLEITRNLPWQE